MSADSDKAGLFGVLAEVVSAEDAVFGADLADREAIAFLFLDDFSPLLGSVARVGFEAGVAIDAIDVRPDSHVGLVGAIGFGHLLHGLTFFNHVYGDFFHQPKSEF